MNHFVKQTIRLSENRLILLVLAALLALALTACGKESESDIITLVDVDFDEYRRKTDMKSVRRNVTLPSWLNFEAEKSGINVSAVLQKALKRELHITNR